MKYRKWKKSVKIFLYCLFIVVIVFVFIYYFGGRCSVCKKSSHVVHDYEEILGIEPGKIVRGEFCVNYILERFGDPLEIEFSHYSLRGKYLESHYSVYMKYPSFTFLLSCTDENKGDPSTWEFYGTMITAPSIRFNNGVHIGMSRRQVIWAYRHIGDYRDPGLKLGDFYYESYFDIAFLYDEHDCVTSITFLG